jgi:hypothetical protein
MTEIVRLPIDRVYVAVLTKAMELPLDLTYAANRVASEVVVEPYHQPTRIGLSAQALDTYVGFLQYRRHRHAHDHPRPGSPVHAAHRHAEIGDSRHLCANRSAQQSARAAKRGGVMPKCGPFISLAVLVHLQCLSPAP